MIIYTNDGNPFGLQLLVLTRFAKKKTTVKSISLADVSLKSYRQLPVLELDSGVQLFSTVAAAKYFFPDEGVERDEWLEWSTTQLAPALAHNLGVGHHSDANALPILNGLVKKLDDQLKSSAFITGDKITIADLYIWCLLAPDGTLKGAQNIENLISWHRKITDSPEIKEATSEQPLKALTFGSLQQSNHFGGFQYIPLCTPSTITSSNLLAETAGNLGETVTDEEIQAAKDGFVTKTITKHEEPRTVLPKKGERNILITSALPYVNNVPHLGNIIGCVLSADIFARYSRMCGYNTLYICGTDEYGTATENKALAEGLSPKEICDKYFELHNSIYRWFGIGFDYFGRTTTAEQTEIVQEAFKIIYDAGYILNQSVEQLLCQKCNRFLADRFVEGTCPHVGCGYEDARGDQCDKCGKLVNAIDLIRPRCTVCNTTPVIRTSEQLFLDLPKIEPILKQWVEKTEGGWTNNARVITRAWLREGLKPRCITRDLKWGIPVPLKGFESKVFYVWFDAPYGYVSITKRYNKDHYMDWWKPSSDVKVELFQFMAKDNVPFHSVMFPSCLLAINKGQTMVSHIMATEYLNYEDGKFSKSRGIGIFGNDVQQTDIPSDVWRFYLASTRPEGQDSSFNWNDLLLKINSDLLNNLGNFVNRALVFCEKNYNSIIPTMSLTKAELIFLALVNREVKGYVQCLEKARLRDGLRHILSISRHGNGYIQAQQPWVLLKGTDDEKARAATIIGVSCNIACLLANLLFPYMPTSARNLYNQLNYTQSHINAKHPVANILLNTGHKINKPWPLFTKIEKDYIEDLKKRYSGSQESASKSNGVTTIAELEKMIKEQGDKVRALKQSKADKTVWQPEVDVLLNLKKRLVKLQTPSATTSPSTPTNSQNTTNQPNSGTAIKDLEDKIAKQGTKVRELKSSSDASVWKPEVEILLALKKELSSLTGAPAAGPSTKTKKKK